MCIAIVAGRYPSKQSPYEYAFVHARVKEYLRKGVEVKVLVPARVAAEYEFEGVVVYRYPVGGILRHLARCNVVMVHLLHVSHVAERDGSVIYEYLLREGVPVVFFVHGVEAQRVALARRYQLSLVRPRSWAVLVYHDFFQIPKMKGYLDRFMTRHPRVRFVAVSRWMLQEVKRNLGIDLRPKAVIIPNGIETERFAFKDRWALRERLLTIRPLILRGKYAVDLAVETMRHVSPPLVLDIYGKGADARKIRKRIRSYHLERRIRLIEKFVPHSELPSVHEGHGIYYAVTRMDAQGVSMCEAMASGLAVVSFNVSGIPEFIEHGKTGLLIDPYNVREAAEALQTLVMDREFYTRIVENARRFVESIDIALTTEKELEVAKRLAS